MSGLLQRLARQALEADRPVVHSMARLPYLAPFTSARAEEMSAVIGDAPLPSERVESEALESDPIRRSPPAATAASQSLRGETASGASATKAGDPRTVVGEVASKRADSPRRSRGGGDDLGYRNSSGAALVHLPTEVVPEVAPSWKGVSSDRSVAPVTPSAIQDRGDGTTPRLPARMVATVETTPTGQRIGSSTDGPGSGGPLSPQEAEPSEVHVHIGRIEVTAVQDPAPPKRRRRSTRKPMSLDDYLAKRKGSAG